MAGAPSAPGPGKNVLWRRLAPPALLFLLTLAVFAPALTCGFVNFDDDVYVYRNSRVTGGFTWSAVAWFFTHTACDFYHPLTMITFLVDHTLYGLRPWGYHLTSILLHALTAALLFLALSEMTGARWRSAFVAAVFALHPLRVESVAWISERKDVLCGLFFVLSLLAYVRYVRRPRATAYGVLVLVYIMGLLAKPAIVTLPFLLLLLDFWPLGRINLEEKDRSELFKRGWSLILEKLPLLALSAAACFVAVHAEGKSVISLDHHPFLPRLLNIPVSYAAYLLKTFVPTRLAPYYPSEEFPLGLVAFCAVLIIGLTVAAVFYTRRLPWLAVGWFWYLGMLVPMIGIVQIGAFARADRFTYLPQIGLIIALTWGGWELGRRLRWSARAFSLLAGAILVTLAGLSIRQTFIWKDSETLFRHTLAVTKRNAVAHFNLGVALEVAEQGKEALEHFETALKIWPNYQDAHLNLGLALAEQHRPLDAIPHLQRAVTVSPDNANAFLMLGACLAEAGHSDAAIAAMQQALHVQPDYPEAANQLGGQLRRQGRLEEAIALYERALKLKPDYADAHNNLGVALCHAGREREGFAQFRQALIAEPDHAGAKRNLDALLQINPALQALP